MALLCTALVGSAAHRAGQGQVGVEASLSPPCEAVAVEVVAAPREHRDRYLRRGEHTDLQVVQADDTRGVPRWHQHGDRVEASWHRAFFNQLSYKEWIHNLERLQDLDDLRQEIARDGRRPRQLHLTMHLVLAHLHAIQRRVAGLETCEGGGWGGRQEYVPG